MNSSKVESADRSIGAILIDAGRLNPDAATRILQYAKAEGLRFGEAGLKLGLLTEDDIRYALSVQFSYPYLPGGQEAPVGDELVAAYQPFSAEGERSRALRSQLQLRWFDEDRTRKTLAVTSPSQGDGRSYVAGNLAITFAQLGERTLLIDGDLRHPRQHQLFRLPTERGLSTLLAGRTHEQVVSFVPGLPELAILPSGPVPPNPLELLSRSNFDRILEQSTSAFDVVIIDTPAVESGGDALLLSRFAGAALTIARQNETKIKAYKAMLADFTFSGVRVVGSVMMDLPRSSKRKGWFGGRPKRSISVY